MNIRNSSIKLMEEAKNYMKNHDYSNALKIINQILSINPNDDYAKISYANILFALNRKKEAKEILLKLTNNHNLEIKLNSMYYLGRILISESKYKEAKNYFEQILKTPSYKKNASCIELYKYYVKIEMDTRKGYEILNKYGDKDDIKIIYFKAEAELKMGNSKDAERTINQVRQKSNSTCRRQINILRGKIETRKDSYYKALELFDSIIDEDLKDNIYYEAIIEKAILKMEFSLYDEAIDLCENVINNNENLKNRALSVENIVYIHLNNYEKAIEKAMKIQEDGNNDYKYYCRLAKTEYYFKNYKKALNIYNKIIQMDNCSSAILDISNYWCAIIKYKLGYGNPIKNIRRIKNKLVLSYNGRNIDVLKNALLHSTSSYSSRQLEHYSIVDAINHIDRVHELNDRKSYFDKDIDIFLLIDEISSMLTDDNLTDNNLFETHHINYENIGYVDGVLSNTLEVVALPNSNKILTMYPVFDKKVQECAKIKQKSQIEKFYERYGKTS